MSELCGLCHKFASTQKDIRCAGGCLKLFHVKCAAADSMVPVTNLSGRQCAFQCSRCAPDLPSTDGRSRTAGGAHDLFTTPPRGQSPTPSLTHEGTGHRATLEGFVHAFDAFLLEQRRTNAALGSKFDDLKDSISKSVQECVRGVERLTATTNEHAAKIAELSLDNERLSSECASLKAGNESLRSRICALEAKAADPSPPTRVSNEADIEAVIAEYEDRRRRSRNLILFNLEESDGSAGNRGVAPASDRQRVQEVLRCIKPADYDDIRVRRIGRGAANKTRPVCLTLSSEAQAVDILRSKTKYPGPVKIDEDRTMHQLMHLQELRKQLASLNDANKTIRFVKGTPRIVEKSTTSQPKNGNANS